MQCCPTEWQRTCSLSWELVWKTEVKNFPSGCRAEALGSSPDGCIRTPTALLSAAINHRPGKPPDGSASQCVPVTVPSIKPRLGLPALIPKVKQANGPTKSMGVPGTAALTRASWFGLCQGGNASGGSRNTAGAQQSSTDFCFTGSDAGQ